MTPAVARGAVDALGRAVLDRLLPPRCLGCGAVVAEPGVLCVACWREADFIVPPCCVRCGYPFELEFGEPVACAACVAEPPAYDRARAVLAYDDTSRAILLALKHADRTDHVPGLAAWMARSGAELLADADLVAPVPLHRRRLRRRRYNQAALLARALAGRAEAVFVPDLLERRRDTPSQGGLSRPGRRRNVRGAFRVRQSRAGALAGRRVLLVDDVMTTGATAEACARALGRAGAAGVDVLTAARVVRPGEGR